MGKHIHLIAKLSIVFCAIVWGGSFVLVKFLGENHGPGFILAVRFTIAAFLIALTFRKRLSNINFQTIKHGSIVGIAVFLGFLCQTTGLMFTDAGKSAFLSTTYCVLTPFVYWIITHNRPKANHFIAGLVCLAGIGFVSLKSSFTLSFGDSITLLCGVFYAIEIAMLSTLCRKDDMMMITLVEMSASAIFAWIYVFFMEDISFKWTAFELSGFFYIAIIGTFIGLTLQNWAQKYVESAESALLLAFEAISGAVLGWIFLNEGVTPRLLLGFGLILLSVIISELGEKKEAEESDKTGNISDNV